MRFYSQVSVLVDNYLISQKGGFVKLKSGISRLQISLRGSGIAGDEAISKNVILDLIENLLDPHFRKDDKV